MRSYGIYLWHWPVMMLSRPGIDVPWRGTFVVLAQIAVTIGLAALSYRYVEMPVRSGSAQRRLRAWLDGHTPRERLRWTRRLAGWLRARARADARPARPRFGCRLGADGHPGRARAGFEPRGGVAWGRGRHGCGLDFVRERPRRRRVVQLLGLILNRLPTGPILALGDSVMLGCAPVLEQRLGSRLRVDAVVGRQAVDTISRLAEYRAHGDLPATVIVQIGDNGPVWYDNLQRLREVLSGVPHVVLVNVRVARSWQGEVDKALAEYVSSWPQAVLADWYSHSSESLLVDGVHPSVAGRAIYARVVLEALREAAGKG